MAPAAAVEEEKEQLSSTPSLRRAAGEGAAMSAPSKDGRDAAKANVVRPLLLGGGQQRRVVSVRVQRTAAAASLVSPPSAAAASSARSSCSYSSAAPPPPRSRRVVVTRVQRSSPATLASAPSSASSQPQPPRFPPLRPAAKATASLLVPAALQPSPLSLASAPQSPSSTTPLPLLPLSSSTARAGRVLLRHFLAGRSFSAFQSALAERVGRSPSALVVAHSGEEHRMRVERASLGEQQRRIAREAAAQHCAMRLTDKEEDGGLSLPWEQSLRGAAVHEVQVGNLFSGLYCRITMPTMDDMTLIRTTQQITEAEQREDDGEEEEEQEEGEAEPVRGGAARPSAGRSTLLGGQSSSRALVSLVQEAARLQQLTRLAHLGRRGHKRRSRGPQREARDGEAEEEEEGEKEPVQGGVAAARLKLSDLLIRGSPLLAELTPSTPAPGGEATRASRLMTPPSSSSSSLLPPSSASSSASPGLLACPSLLSFPARPWYEGEVESRTVQLSNSTDRTLHFDIAAVEEGPAGLAGGGGGAGGPSGPFFVSHPSHYLLPHSAVSLFISFAPAGCGVYRQRLCVVEVDGESADACEVELLLEGVSAEPALLDNRGSSASACRRVMSDLHSDASSLLTSLVGGWMADAAAARPLDAEQRPSFTRLNRAAGLHYHPNLAPAWWALWEDVRALHPPLRRPAMQWSLRVQQLQDALHTAPARHRGRARQLQQRLEQLKEAARERPAVHPARARLLSSLLSALARALPSFASELQASLQLSEQPPWAARRAEREQRVAEAGEQLQPSAEGAVQQLQQPPVEQAGAAKGDSEEETRADAGWKELRLQWRVELHAETAAVLSAALDLFAARAQPEGSDKAPTVGNDDEEAQLPTTADGTAPQLLNIDHSGQAVSGSGPGLPRAFRRVAPAEVEVETAVAEAKKGKSSKGGAAKTASTPKKRAAP